jgi:hypothetical protein
VTVANLVLIAVMVAIFGAALLLPFPGRRHEASGVDTSNSAPEEAGSYPGQPWLWLYTLWYQVPGWTNSANIDMIAIYMTGLATLLLLCVPFIPGLRDLPRLVPVHRLIWRSWYRSGDRTGPGN